MNVTPILTAVMVAVLVGGLMSTVANQTTGQAVSGVQNLYHKPPTGTSLVCNTYWSQVNSGKITSNSFDNATGYQQNSFVGKTLVTIGFYLCAVPTNSAGLFGTCPIVSSQQVTIGVFNNSTWALVQSYGTVPVTSLPCDTNGTHNFAEFTFTSSHTIASTDMIGITYSDNAGNGIRPACAGSCAGNEASGWIVDCKSNVCSNTFDTPRGFGLGADFTFAGANQNITSSPGLAGGLTLYPLVFAGIGLLALWLLGTKHQQGGV